MVMIFMLLLSGLVLLGCAVLTGIILLVGLFTKSRKEFAKLVPLFLILLAASWGLLRLAHNASASV